MGAACRSAWSAELAEGLLAVHGQSDQLRLSRPAEQRRALDRYAGAAHLDLLDRYRAAHQRWRELAADLERRRSQARELAQAADVLRHGLEEIEAVAPRAGRGRGARHAGQAARRRRRAPRRGRRGARRAGRRRDRRPRRATSSRRTPRRRWPSPQRALAASDDPALVLLAQDLADAVAVVSDVAGQLAGYVADLDADPGRLAEVLDRRAVITALVRKYAGPGEGLAGVLAWAEDAAGGCPSSTSPTRRSRRSPRPGTPPARRSTTWRRRSPPGAAPPPTGFAAEVGAELAGLAMKSATVSFSSTATPRTRAPRASTRSRCCSLPHPGAPPRPVHKGASGGELSRVMLAIEVVFAGADPVPVMVFDEVDAGVGGQAAGEIGRRLARLARDHQVVVVTHLAQVAAFADTHLVVDKSPDTGAGVTATDIRAVDGEDRVRELARMLSGLTDSDTGQAHARELLAVAVDARG